MTGARAFRIVRVKGREPCAGTRDFLAVEEPLEIRVDSQPLAVTMRTPGHDEELGAGFLFSEGIIRKRGDLIGVQKNARNKEGNSIDFFLKDGLEAGGSREKRRFVIHASCGVCGRQSIQETLRKLPPLAEGRRVGREAVRLMAERLNRSQELFAVTGGLHGAALFTLNGKLLVSREDVGRHNAVDKVAGWGLLGGRAAGKCALMVSGRISFEIVQKALNAGIPVVAGVSAPTSLAVELARRGGMTLIGFARGENFNVYAGQAG